MLIRVAAVLAATAIGCGVGVWLNRRQRGISSDLSETRQRKAFLEMQNSLFLQKLSVLQQEHSQLQESHRLLTQERENLASQSQATEANLKNQIQTLTQERQRLTTIARRLTQETDSLKVRYGLSNRKAASLQQANQELTLQRDAIQRQLAQAEKETKDPGLKKTLPDTKSVVEELEARLKQLQQAYAAAVSENSTLRKQASKAPHDVTKLAREHERLIRETAAMHYNLGVIFTRDKQYARAVKEFLKVIELRPDDADAHYNLGVIYAEHLPNRQKAIEYFRKYMRMNPNAQDASWVKQYIATWQTWEGKERLN